MDENPKQPALNLSERMHHGIASGAILGATLGSIDTLIIAAWGDRIPIVLPAIVIGTCLIAGALLGATVGIVWGVVRRAKNVQSANDIALGIRRACIIGCIVGACVLFLERGRLGYETFTASFTGLPPLLAGLAVAWCIAAFASKSRSGGNLWPAVCVAVFCTVWQPVSRLYDAPLFSAISLFANAALAGLMLTVYFVGRRFAGKSRTRQPRLNESPAVMTPFVIAAAGCAASVALLSAMMQSPIDTTSAARDARTATIDQPDIILIVMDTVRADRMSVYDHSAPTTPNLDAFAQNAVVFQNAIAPSSWTLPTHASMFTGLMPSEHGADNIRTRDGSWTIRPLSPARETLAETLADAGYRTGAVVSNTACLSREFGVHRGFAFYDDVTNPSLAAAKPGVITPAAWICHWLQLDAPEWKKGWSRSAEEINEQVIAWLDREPNKPCFLFINYLDAHAPYHERPKFKQILAGFAETERNPHVQPSAADDLDRYDQEIAYLDDRIGALFENLKIRNRFDNAIIIVTSDHGEAFGEHGQLGHGKTLYQEEIHVPLIVRAPGMTGRVDLTPPISLASMPELILSLAGGISTDGREYAIGDWTVLAELRQTSLPVLLHEPVPVARALFDGSFTKLITDAGGKNKLFDLQIDPHELADTSADRIELVRHALLAASEWMTRLVRHTESDDGLPISSDLTDQLKSLGYLR